MMDDDVVEEESVEGGDLELRAKDVKLVTAVSTFHNDSRVPGRRAGAPIVKPTLIAEYNRYMGGVDSKDQQLSMYLRFDVHGAQEGDEMKTPVAAKPLSHRQFRMEVALGLLEKIPEQETRRNIRPNDAEIPRRLMKGVDHFVLNTPTTGNRKSQKRCVRCLAANRRTMLSLNRERDSNFTREECDTLIQLDNENKHVLENKESDTVTWAEKEQCWQRIETKFNSISSVRFRSAKALKIKYDGLRIKRDTRKKSAAIRAEMYRTGGGPSTAPILTPSEEKVKDMILLSVEGMNSLFHSDQIIDADTAELITEWTQWKPTSLRAKKQPALCKQKPKRPFEKLAESKLEIAAIQKQILEEELQNKRKQWLFKEEKREHKRAMWALEKQRL
ncbi:hypothetical protein evm_007460 [Chilo suppressalis]|nr:hypothetical protein evm_007460 [Chilo suppressalis]